MRAHSALFGLLLLLPLAACPAEPAPEGATGCASDADCLGDARCEPDGTCRPRDGGAGGGAPEETCGTSDDCLLQPFTVIAQFEWDGRPGIDPVCTLPEANCPPGDTCAAPMVCREVSTDATIPGGFRCERDEDCWSGRCLPFGEGRLCLRSCTSDGDCPFSTGADGERIGYGCRDDVVDGFALRRCVPVEETPPGASLCRSARDCADGQDCRFFGATADVPEMSQLPLCAPPRAGRPTLSSCPPDAADCDGGSCGWPCDGGNGDEGNVCRSPPLRCTAPCERDEDCPARAVCGIGEARNRVGIFPPPFAGEGFTERPGRDVKGCILARPGCFDELDCCPTPQPDGTCRDGWTQVDERCGITLQGPPGALRLLTLCRPPDGRGVPGACCTSHGDCDGDLCVPAREGGSCAGGGVCTTPCDPTPDPDGVPGSGDERDRCALVETTGDALVGSTCQPFLYERDGVAQTLRVCR